MASNKLTHSPRGVDRGGHAKSSFSLSQRLSRQVWKVCSILVTASPPIVRMAPICPEMLWRETSRQHGSIQVFVFGTRLA